MNIHWKPPSNGILKINVHVESFVAPLPNDNTHGIGVVLRTSVGSLVNYVAGTIPNLSTLGCQLWGIQVRLRRGFIERATDIIIETDNMEGFRAVRFSHLNQHS